MKTLLKIFAVLMLLCSCNNPDGKVYKEVKVNTEMWEIIPHLGVKQQVNEVYVVVQPTWGQSFYFAFKDGYTLWLIIGIVLFAGFALVIYLLASKKMEAGLKTNGLWIVLLALSLVSFFWMPGDIKWQNNDLEPGSERIKVQKARWESTPDKKQLWEDLYKEKRIVGTSGK